MEVLLICALAIAVWWGWSARSPGIKVISSQVMDKWIETIAIGGRAVETNTAAQLGGKTVSIPNFCFQYVSTPEMLHVSVMGSGAYLGFRGETRDDGRASVWFEDGAGSRAKKLVSVMTQMYPVLIDGDET